ncbi:MAG: hypothetical protein U0841_35260 [Chloroflexia bacterium]
MANRPSTLRATQRTAPSHDHSSRRRIRRRTLGEPSDEQLIRHAQNAPQLLRAPDMLRLQNIAGNRAVANHIARLTDPTLAQRDVIQRDDPPQEQEQNENEDTEGNQGGVVPQEGNNQVPGEQQPEGDNEPEIPAELKKAGYHLKSAVKKLDSVFVNSKPEDAPGKMDRLLSERSYEPGVRAWETLVEATRQIVQQETNKGVKRAPKSLFRSFASRDRATKHTASAGQSRDRWMGVADSLRETKVLKKMFRGIVNSRLKATDKNLSKSVVKAGEKTEASEREFSQYNESIVRELRESPAGRLYQQSAGQVVNIMKEAKEDVEDTDNFQIAFTYLGTIRVDPRVEARR